MRMIVYILIKLYTARVVLNVLGVTDYGIYNLVAGLIVLFAFLNSAMNGASQRFFNVAMGLGDSNRLRDCFINSVNAHLLIGVVSVLLAETVGLYLFYYQINIPADRFGSALFAFHTAVIACFITILRTPYNAIIIAYERMSFYAYISIVEAILNLMIVFVLPGMAYDKLKSYSLLMLAVVFCISIIYPLYCHKKFPVTKYSFSFNGKTIRKILSFSTWSTFSSFATVGSKQGLDILLNISHGVALNAATAIMNQVSSAIYSFIQNFQMAVNPQLTKNYAAQDWIYFRQLFYAASKFSFYLILILSLPVMLSMNEILRIWLKNVPDYTAAFCILSIIGLMINALGGPVWTAIQASGTIKKYQACISGIILLNIPAYYILLVYLKLSPPSALYIPIITNIIVVAIGLRFILKRQHITLQEYTVRVLYPITKVGIAGVIFPVFARMTLESRVTSVFYMLIITAISTVSIAMSIYISGLTAGEKDWVSKKIKFLFHRNINDDFDCNPGI